MALNRGRTTFQRTSDAKFFNGWIKVITAEVVVAHTCTSCTLSPGDEFAFQVYGNRKDAFFRARLKAFQRAEPGAFLATDLGGAIIPLNLGCEILSQITSREGSNQPRFFVEGVTADITVDQDVTCEGSVVIDIGPGGFAALTMGYLRKGDIVDATLHAYGLEVTCQAEVRNTTRNALDERYQRVGYQMLAMERLDELRWKQVYNLVQEQSRAVASKLTGQDRPPSRLPGAA